jgi:nucleoside-diphosphate-sugar epimerase
LTIADDINNNPKRPFSNAMEAYWASKALARMTTRDFVLRENPQFDYVSLLPSVVIGPDQRISKNAESLLEGTRAAVLAPALTSSLNSSFPYVGVPVHVADVARAHVDAIDKLRVPGNTEYILSSDTPDGVEWDRDVRNICEKYFPDQVKSGVLPLQGSLAAIKWRLDGATTENVFGWRFTSFEETMRQLVAQYLHLKSQE